MSVALIQLPPAAEASQGANNKLLLISCCWAPENSYLVWTENCFSLLAFPHKSWQIRGQCVHELGMMMELPFKLRVLHSSMPVSFLEATAADQPLWAVSSCSLLLCVFNSVTSLLGVNVTKMRCSILFAVRNSSCWNEWMDFFNNKS